MSYSNVSLSSSSYSTTSSQRSSGPSSAVIAALKALKEAADSGDLTQVQTAYDTVTKLQSTDSSSSDTDTPLSRILSAVSSGLDDSDIDAVKAALQPPQGGPQGGPPPGGPQGGPPPGGGASKGVASAIDSLSSALQTDDTDSAKTAYEKLLEALEDEDSEDSSSTSSTTTYASASTTNAASAVDALKQFLTQLGSAIESGDTETASKTLSALIPHRGERADYYA